jgi:cysteine desulfurase
MDVMTQHAEQTLIYLDHNATTPILPEVVDAMLPYLREHFGNPSSGHALGLRTRQAVQHAREQVAGLIGCEPDEVLFTSGGTEANNLAIHGVTEASARRGIVTSVIEHPATALPCDWLERNGWQVSRIPVDVDGRARVDEAVIDARTALVTVMHSNNETGVLQPISELAVRARSVGALVHTDAAQSIGKVPVNVGALGVDLLSIAGHKLYAPKGVGALFVKRGTPIVPFALGAGHERGMRPGTENVASIVGLGAACEAMGRDLAEASQRMCLLRDLLWTRLADLSIGKLRAMQVVKREPLPRLLHEASEARGFAGEASLKRATAHPALCSDAIDRRLSAWHALKERRTDAV